MARPRTETRQGPWLVGKTLAASLAYNSLPIFILLAIWEAIARSGAVHAALFPSLEAIWAALATYWSEGLLPNDLKLSLLRVGGGVGVGIVAGTALGLAMGSIRPLERLMVPVLQFFLSIPGIAIMPLTILWFGLSELSLQAVIVLEAAVVVAVNAWTGVKSTSKTLINAARTLGVSGLALYHRILLPAALPFIITGYRQGLSRGWRILVAGEMIAAAGSGLGYRIFSAQEFMKTDLMYGGILVIGVLGLLLERVILRSIEQYTVERWGLVR